MPPWMNAIDRFNNSYIPEPNSGCWLWEKSLNNNGYGLLQGGGYKGYAHRFSYSTFRGPIPNNMDVCHNCDLPCCVNPDHLWLGTAIDNMKDCKKKGRHASDKPDTNYARGEMVSLSKLNTKDIIEIRSLNGKLSHQQIASRFGVSRNNIRNIQRNRTWKHV